jgi:predicted nucleotidyltransferase
MKTVTRNKTYLTIKGLVHSLIDSDFDLFLIGSRVSSDYERNSDYDYILILKKKVTEIKLIEISIIINYKLNENKNNKTSIKIFDLITFKEFIFQDYFRFYEYKISNKNLTDNSTFFNSFDISLTDDFLQIQMVNSIIIQFWWSIITISNNTEMRDTILKKLIFRLNRNSHIYNSLAKEKISINQIKKNINQDFLYSQIDNLENYNYSSFLKKYFKRFRHEKINKFDYYNQTLESKLDDILVIKNYSKNLITQWN